MFAAACEVDRAGFESRKNFARLSLRDRPASSFLWTCRESNSELTHAKGTVFRLPTGPTYGLRRASQPDEL